jgi:hypothetical protein
MATKYWPRTSLTGGVDGSLDNIDGALLTDGDHAFVLTATHAYFYVLDDDSGAAESSPDVISPDSNAGNKRWILLDVYGAALPQNLDTTDSPTFVTVKLSGLTDGKIPYHVDDAAGLADGPTKADVDDAVSKKHTQDTDTKIVVTASPGSDHQATGVIVTLTAGEALVFGNNCYLKSDTKMWKAKADADTTMPGIALCLETISANNSGLFLLLGVARDDSWAWTVGGLIYADSGTAGALTQTAPSTATHYVQPIGIATHADRMFFKPDLTLLKVK